MEQKGWDAQMQVGGDEVMESRMVRWYVGMFIRRERSVGA